MLRLKRALTITDIGHDITRFLCASKGLFTNRPSLQNVKDLAYKIVPCPSLRNFEDLAYEFNIPEGLRVSAAVGFVEWSRPIP